MSFILNETSFNDYDSILNLYSIIIKINVMRKKKILTDLTEINKFPKSLVDKETTKGRRTKEKRARRKAK